jgi:hypothetical protein
MESHIQNRGKYVRVNETFGGMETESLKFSENLSLTASTRLQLQSSYKLYILSSFLKCLKSNIPIFKK